MHILWVKRLVENDAGGDAVVDAKLVYELRKHHAVTTVEVKRNTLMTRLMRMATHFLPPDRAGYGTAKDADRVADICEREKTELIIISHEHLDYLVRVKALAILSSTVPVVLVHHNITSSAMNQILGGVRGRIAEYYYQAYERRLINKASIYSHIVLSHDDRRCLMKVAAINDVKVVMPGVPMATTLSDMASVEPDLVLLGTFDWYPKRWSLQQFVEEWESRGEKGPQIYVDKAFPGWALGRLGARPADELDFGSAIRFGVLTDRFKAGHKLKTAAYIMSNCFVVSYASVVEDFRFSKDADFFIRTVSGLKDIAAVVREIASYDVEVLRGRLERFKREVADNMSWERQAEKVLEVIESTSVH